MDISFFLFESFSDIQFPRLYFQQCISQNWIMTSKYRGFLWFNFVTLCVVVKLHQVKAFGEKIFCLNIFAKNVTKLTFWKSLWNSFHLPSILSHSIFLYFRVINFQNSNDSKSGCLCIFSPTLQCPLCHSIQLSCILALCVP